jgi:hypothetical protein
LPWIQAIFGELAAQGADINLLFSTNDRGLETDANPLHQAAVADSLEAVKVRSRSVINSNY